MTNSAGALADLFQQWEVPPQHSPEKVRAATCGKQDTLAFWQAHAHAVEMLRDVEREIVILEQIGHDMREVRQVVPEWYRAVFAFTTPWKTSGTGVRPAVSNSAHIAMLRMVGTLMDAVKRSPELSELDVEEITTALDMAEELIRSARGSIGDNTWAYLLALIGEARSCLEHLDAYSVMRVRTVTFELSGALQSQAVLADSRTVNKTAEAGRWREAARRLVAWTGRKVAEAAITSAMTVAGSHALPAPPPPDVSVTVNQPPNPAPETPVASDHLHPEP